jgi:hypothetical protein
VAAQKEISMRRLWIGIVMMLAIALVIAAAHPAAAQTSVVAEAQQLYDEGKAADAYFKLKSALSAGTIPSGQIIPAKELMARCLVKTGSRLEARELYKEILRQDPGYRPDPIRTPPDELEVYRQASKEVVAEQIVAGRRIPASIGFTIGTGSARNEDIAAIAVVQGGNDTFEGKGEFGGTVRFPLRPRWSMEIELLRLRATNHDALTAPDPGNPLIVPVSYVVTALPLIASVSYTAIPGERLRMHVFAGAGALLAATSDMKLLHDHGVLIPVTLAARETGPVLQAGLEGEYLLNPRFSMTARALLRHAATGELQYERPDYEVYDGFSESRLQGRTIDFSGYNVALGVRAYVGY